MDKTRKQLEKEWFEAGAKSDEVLGYGKTLDEPGDLSEHTDEKLKQDIAYFNSNINAHYGKKIGKWALIILVGGFVALGVIGLLVFGVRQLF